MSNAIEILELVREIRCDEHDLFAAIRRARTPDATKFDRQIAALTRGEYCWACGEAADENDEIVDVDDSGEYAHDADDCIDAIFESLDDRDKIR